MTVKDIRQFIKNLNGTKKEKVIEDKDLKSNIDKELSELEESYNPKEEYPIEYFKSKDKQQLLEIIRQLQKEFQNLLKKKGGA